MAKLVIIPLIVFSILLLVPVGGQNAFAGGVCFGDGDCTNAGEDRDGNSCTGVVKCVGNTAVTPGVCAQPPRTGPSCNDGLQCTTGDTCVVGVCIGAPNTGNACNDGNQCSVGDQCVVGVCVGAPNTGNACGDAGTQCTNQDTCVLGTCNDNGFESAGTACGDSSSGVCDNPNTCDGAGTCDDNFELNTTVCREDAGVCDVAELCDGAGSCPVDGFEPAGTACTCNVGPGECDGSNLCVGFVLIDVKPGSFPNSINTKSMGKVPVAFLGSNTFDVTDVDVTTLEFGPSGATPVHDLTDPDVYASHLEDVNNDGFTDLVSHYIQKETGIACGVTEATLTGNHDGQPIEGTDSVRPVPCK